MSGPSGSPRLASGTFQRLIFAQSNWNRSIASAVVIQRYTLGSPYC
jgi:hypothetical protein